MPSRIPSPEIDATLDVVADEWRRKGEAIAATYRFGTFRRALAFMNEVADEAEKRQHHPKWTNLYDEVKIELSTHEAGGVTEYDIEFAVSISGIARAHRELQDSDNATERTNQP